MTMVDTTAAAVAEHEGQERAQLQPPTRIDWRTGRPMLIRDGVFWKEHAARRIEQGLSVAAYCDANGLAKSTFRRYACAGNAGSQGSDTRAQTPARPSRFVPIHAAPAPTEALVVEIETGDGMKLRLAGAAADRLMQHVLARLA